MDILSQDAPVVQVTNMILEDAVRQKASDILIEPFDKKLRIRLRLDGVLHEQKAPPASLHSSIVTRIKVIADLNIAEHRLPQDGRFKMKIGRKEIDYRVSILPSSFGEKVAIRILDKSQATLDIAKLGFSDDTVEKIKRTARLPHGMMLVCGPTGSGKTTTLYSILRYADKPDLNLVTVEDPVEYQLEGVNQVTVKPEIGLTFASALRSILRQDPDIIMIGEIRDYETVDIAIKSALTGHLVLSTLHTTTAPGAVVRLVNMGVEPFMINASIVCVQAQRLVRQVCKECRQKYELKKDIMDKLQIRIPPGLKPEFYRGRGCRSCFKTGYAGRSGISEVLLLTPALREAVLKREQEHVIKKLARSEGMRTLREDGIKLA
ncbi:MAG: GspE/PulE family protein, partial [Candidatus Omnitrophica bacterium]|nr:GspE/PulE family protein [Candidatus Omnitrophota bacterium]